MARYTLAQLKCLLGFHAKVTALFAHGAQRKAVCFCKRPGCEYVSDSGWKALFTTKSKRRRLLRGRK